MTHSDATPRDILRDTFGYDDFRPGQLEIIEHILDGDDLLGVMPTGSGKSLCYQLPACLLDGVVVVVSPLIALMQDQLETVQAADIPSTVINSSVSRSERRQRLSALADGDLSLVFVAPERFDNERFQNALDSIDVGLLAVDEAHCISHWGHDFRPDYLRLGEVREQLDEPPVLALTATATRQVREDILEQLDIPDAEIVLGGFERPNLYFDVFHAVSNRDKLDRTADALEERPGHSSVVYCATRKQVEEVYDHLDERDLVAGAYHGGMKSSRRAEIQSAFMAGDLPILVATNAFGMGVDKSDIRNIIHFNMPGSLEAYYQEAGRAGRDGEPARCLLMYDPSDRDIHDFFVENSYPEIDIIEGVWRQLAKRGTGRHEVGAETIADHLSRSPGQSSVHPWAVETSLNLLSDAGHISTGRRQGQPWVEVRDRSRVRDLRIDRDRLKERRDISEKHIKDVVTYAEGNGCRQAFLLHYFGTTPSFGDHCERCDNCGAQWRQPTPTVDRIDSDELSDSPRMLVQKVLSGAARTDGRAHPIDLAAMLRGSSGQRVSQMALDDLSTYGVADAVPQHLLVNLIEHCLESELLTADRDGRVQLTQHGADIMVDDSPLPTTLERWIRNQFPFS